MDTNVPAVESENEPGKEATVNGGTMLYSKPPENADIALFKQQMSTLSTSPSIVGSGVSSEQTEEIIGLSHEFKDLLESKNFMEAHQAALEVDKKHTSSFLSEISGGKAGTQNSKTDVHIGKTNMPAHGQIPTDKKVIDDKVILRAHHSEPKADTSNAQDNPYVVAPGITPLMTHTNSTRNAGAVEPQAAMIAQQIKEQVIDRILVSTNDIAANKMVKVVINPNVLQGTEVNFQKTGDVLSVQFASKNESSLQFLQVNQSDLQGYLQGELKQFKGVSVSVKSSENSTDYPADGRSRNRYEYQAPDEDEQ